MIHHIEEVRLHDKRLHREEVPKCALGVTDDGLVRIRTDNNHGFHGRLDELTRAVAAMNEEHKRQGRMF